MRLESAGFLRRNVWTGVALFAALIGLANMVTRIGGDVTNQTDFRLVWLAGRAMRAGIDPYSTAYLSEGLRAFGYWSPLSTWVYPPHFWPLSLAFSLFDFRTELHCWNVASIVYVVTAAWLTAAAMRETSAGRLKWAAAIVGFTGITTASGGALWVGQTSFVILLGFALILYGIARQRSWLGAIGMAIVMLKPNFGLVLCCGIPFVRGGLRMSLQGAGIVVALCMPPLLMFGAHEVIAGYLANLGGYRSIAYNLPPLMTGLPNLVFGVTHVELPAIGMSLIGAGLAAGAMLLQRMRGALVDAEAAWTYLVIVGGIAFGTVALHVYDLVLAAPLLIALARGAPLPRILIAIGLLLIVRPENLLPHPEINGPRVASLGCLAFFLAALAQALRPLPPKIAPPIS